MPTVSFQEAGERKTASVGQGNNKCTPFVVGKKHMYNLRQMLKPQILSSMYATLTNVSSS